MTTFNDFYQAYNWLEEHPIFQDVHGLGHFQSGLYIMVVKVNPRTERIGDDDTKNTATRVWLEHGPYRYWTKEEAGVEGSGTTHDYELDCGGTTFEEAIVTLAQLVYNKYGDYDSE